MRLSTLTIAIAALAASIASANALPPVRAGILQCQGGQNVGFVVGSVTSLECVFQSEGRRPEPYIATVRRFGLDLGFTDQTQFSWAVNAPTGQVGRGDLAGNYGGVGANASVGRRRRRQLPGRRSAEFLRAAADQRAGPDRVERRGRYRRHRTAAGPVHARIASSPPAPSPASSSRLNHLAALNERGPRKRASFAKGCFCTGFLLVTISVIPGQPAGLNPESRCGEHQDCDSVIPG